MLEFLCYFLAFVVFVIAAIVLQDWRNKLIPIGLALATLPSLASNWPAA